MKIKVEQRHIDAGKPDEGLLCPIALAMVEHGCGRVFVERQSVALYDFDNRRFVDLPDNAQDFIQEFDNEEPVQPFEFDIDIPEHPQNEVVCPVAERPDSQNAVRNEPHSLITDFLNKLEREPKPLIKV